ncbi:tRNA1(Val) (adenine(37)-N6)-methyltransferase [Oceaniradius stylonematis]|uniref:tRNA1(Val) (adenine(37)-N6)-methyltransferase n=1 Tax=Oceaniradius stylonematis TaxID=2184161 RepID=UPI00273FAF72|nr:methyltransferase [Oceaniradius stylonematis]
MNSRADPGSPTTINAFHRGRFVLVQPSRGRHRAGLDAMLLAATVPAGFDGTLADLGAGAGAAALAVLSRCPDARATLFENDPVMANCARQTMQRAENASLQPRVRIVAADVTLDGRAREAAGLESGRFDQVIANPPFNDARDRQSPNAARAAAHVIDASTMLAWIKTASAIARPGGRFSMIARPSMLADILAGMGRRFGAIAIRPVHPRADEAAIRILVSGVKGSRARLALLPAVVLHPDGASGKFTADADALINGRAALSMES